jgi:hypothetical protein
MRRQMLGGEFLQWRIEVRRGLHRAGMQGRDPTRCRFRPLTVRAAAWHTLFPQPEFQGLVRDLRRLAHHAIPPTTTKSDPMSAMQHWI